MPDLHSKKWLGLCALIFAIVAPATVAGTAIYAHISPSLPLAEHWFDYVDEFPIMEAGGAIEIPGPSAFRWRIEGSYSAFPKAGIIDGGSAIAVSIGIVSHRQAGKRFDFSLGPQFTLGWVKAKGTYNYTEGDSVGYYIDFDSDGNGAGIGIVGGAMFEASKGLRFGIQPAITYFAVSRDDVPIVGRDASDPSVPPDYGVYRYEGEYIALSIRFVLGIEF